jgi:hypothetical protein
MAPKLMAQKVSSQEEREEEERKILIEIIERLSRDSRYEFLLKFKEDLKMVVSPAAISKALRRDFHFKNETILKVIQLNPEARIWLKRKAREEAFRLLELVEALEALEESD